MVTIGSIWNCKEQNDKTEQVHTIINILNQT